VTELSLAILQKKNGPRILMKTWNSVYFPECSRILKIGMLPIKSEPSLNMLLTTLNQYVNCQT